ncbi:MAG: hypothetical protein R3B13_05915 [Polyangiaceae bacterium]
MIRIGSWGAALLAIFLGACGDDSGPSGGGTEADYHGVGASCTKNEDCFEPGQTCLPFKGGYCGIEDCQQDTDCPAGSRCVAHDAPAKNYCFLVCANKPECNRNRPIDFESNCSSNITFVEGGKGPKACVPPS